MQHSPLLWLADLGHGHGKLCTTLPRQTGMFPDSTADDEWEFSLSRVTGEISQSVDTHYLLMLNKETRVKHEFAEIRLAWGSSISRLQKGRAQNIVVRCCRAADVDSLIPRIPTALNTEAASRKIFSEQSILVTISDESEASEITCHLRTSLSDTQSTESLVKWVKEF